MHRQRCREKATGRQGERHQLGNDAPDSGMEHGARQRDGELPQ